MGLGASKWAVRSSDRLVPHGPVLISASWPSDGMNSAQVVRQGAQPLDRVHHVGGLRPQGLPPAVLHARA